MPIRSPTSVTCVASHWSPGAARSTRGASSSIGNSRVLKKSLEWLRPVIARAEARPRPPCRPEGRSYISVLPGRTCAEGALQGVQSNDTLLKDRVQAPEPKRAVVRPADEVTTPVWGGIGHVGERLTFAERPHRDQRIARLLDREQHVAPVPGQDFVIAEHRGEGGEIDAGEGRLGA